MKKLLALVLALAMTLSMSAVSFAEPAEAVTYSNFSEHLMAFLNGLDLQEKDLYLAANVQDQTYQLLVGMNDEGVINVMAGQDQQEIGTLQVDDEAAYLSYQGSIMGLKAETIQNFINNLPQKAMDYLAQLGIDPQQLTTDVQTLMGLFQKVAEKLQPAYVQTEEGDVLTVSLDTENYSEVYAQVIDELLSDASFQDILARYLPMLGAEYNAEEVASAWQSARGQIVDMVKQWKQVITVNQTTGDFTLDFDMPMPGGTASALFGSGNVNENGMNGSFTLTAKQGETEMKEEITISAEKTSPWLEAPNKFSESVVVYQNGQEAVTMNASYELDMFGTPVNCLVTMAQQGQEIIRMEYADGTFVATAQGQEVLFIQYKDGVFTARAQGVVITVQKAEEDADHITFEMAVTQNGETQKVYLVCSIAVDDSGSEYLQIALTDGQTTPVVAQVLQTEKQAFSLLKDQETLNWITEEQLNGLLDTVIASIVAEAQQQIGTVVEY